MPDFMIYSECRNFRRQRDVIIIQRHGDGREFAAAPLVFTDCTNLLIDKPTVAATGGDPGVQFLQAALDHAWEIGLRPRGFLDVPNQVAAMRNHLNDMRALVFKGVGSEVPGAKDGVG